MDFTTAFKKYRHHVWLLSILYVLGGGYIASVISYWGHGFPYGIILGSVLVVVAVYLTLRYRKANMPFDTYADEEACQSLFDRYARRYVNWVLIAFWEVFTLALECVSLGVNSKVNEVLENIFGNLFLIELVAFFLVKNMLLLKWLTSRHAFAKKLAFKRELLWVVLSSAIYWLLAGALFFAFEKVFVLNISPFVTALFVVWIVIYNFTRINRFAYERKRHSRIVIAAVLLIAVVAGGYMLLSRDIWHTQPYINSTPYICESENKIAYDDDTGIYTVTKGDGDFKVLQLTDIHLGGSVLSYDKDLKALKACYALLNETKPDLVVVTGDLSFPMGFASFSFNNTATVQQFAAFMRNTGVPWAFTYGNHDTETMAATKQHDLNALYKSLSYKTSRNLLYPYVQPDIWGRNNQLIEIRNRDGSLFEGLFLIDSNAYTGEGLNKYDYIHDDQVAWYKENVLRMNAEAGHTVKSLMFFHIPLQQYRTAYELYEQGSNEVTWYFGSNDEKIIDKVCCSEYPSAIFDTAKELGSTTGFFCGHDHYNNISLEYQGLRLTYGMSIDYLVMPGIARDTKQRGGTLITIHEDGTEDIVQVPLSTISLAD